MKSDIQWLAMTLIFTALMVLPYVLNRMVVRGVMGAMANPSPNDAPLSEWAQRAQRAHLNAVENLVLFAPAVLAVHFLGRGDDLTGMACAVYFWARLVHYFTYVAGIRGLRTLAFLVGWGAIMVLALKLLA